MPVSRRARKSARTPVRAAARAAPAIGRAAAALQAGRLGEAATICAARLAADPRDAAALHLLGVCALRRGRPDEAVAALGRAVAIEPDNAELHANLGAARRAAGDAAGAVESLSRAIALRPAFASARFNLGNALSDLGRHDEAAAAYRDALALDPAHAGAHNNLGLALAALGQDDAAEPHFRAALAVPSMRRDAHLNLARLLRRRGDLTGALEQFDAALAVAPEDAFALNERGVALMELDRPDEGIAALRRAVARAPDEADFRANLGAALCAAGAGDAGLAEFVAADRLVPGCADTLAGLGHALKQLGRLDEAIAAYDRALSADGENREARFGRAICRLLQGDFAHGWPDYRARESMAAAGPGDWRESLPADLSGKRVLVRRDQGLGDEIFFLRFIPALRARGAAIEYMPDPRLAGMIARAEIASVRDSAAAAGPCDVTLSVGDLPYLLGATDTPAPLSLPPLPDRVAMVAARLAAFGPPPYIGVAWRAGTRNRRSLLYKDAPAAMLAAALRPLDARVVVVQRDPRPGEVASFAAALGRPALDLSAFNDDLETMLALAGALDEHVCVSNTNVHLAAARGRACRILLPHPPEFRWMAAGAESPWFPGMRLYRQTAGGDWRAAFDALAADLAA